MLGRSFWGLTDQAVSSLSSLLLAMMVARVSTPAEVGAWAIGYAAYTFVLTVTRSAVSTTALIADPDQKTAIVDRGAATVALLFGVLVGIIFVSVGLLFSGPISGYLLLFGLSLPILLLDDALRYVLIRRKRPELTTIADVLWILFQAAFGVYASIKGFGGPGVTVGWSAGAAISLAFLLWAAKFPPGLKPAAEFLRANKNSSSKLLLDSVMTAGSANLVPVMLGAIIGLAATGYFRGALTLLGVAGVVVMGLTPIATVEVKSRVDNRRFRRRFLLIWVALLGAVGSSLALFLLWMPDSLGHAMIGDSWNGTSTIILIMSLQVILRGPFTGVSIVLRASRKLNKVLMLRLMHSAGSLVLTLGGAQFYGLQGASWGWAASSVLGSLLAVAVYRRAFTTTTL